MKTETVTRPASAHGWVRRPELDTSSFDAWEMPDGKFYACEKGRTPNIVTLVRWPTGLAP